MFFGKKDPQKDNGPKCKVNTLARYMSNRVLNQYLPHFSFENHEINFIKSNSLKVFQHHQECPQISI
jgi:hypothetical protein